MIIITTPREKKKPENGFDLLFHSSKYQKKNEEAFYLSGIAQNFTCRQNHIFILFFFWRENSFFGEEGKKVGK